MTTMHAIWVTFFIIRVLNVRFCFYIKTNRRRRHHYLTKILIEREYIVVPRDAYQHSSLLHF